jgi:hypothetical protein
MEKNELAELGGAGGTSSTRFSIPNGGCEHFFLHLEWKNWSDKLPQCTGG